MSHKFTYKFFYKIIYRYGNFIASLLMIMYVLPFFFNYQGKSDEVFFSILILILMVILNVYFYRLYKITPYHIEMDDEKLHCKDFPFSDKEVTVYFKDIDKLSGGIFDGRISGLMKVIDSDKDVTIGFFHKITNSKMLEATLLSKVKKELYDGVLDKLGLKKEKLKQKAAKRKKK